MEGISAIITVLTEEKNIRDLMVSLISQEQPFEVTRPSSNLMYSKSLFQSIGGIDERADSC